MKNIWLKYLIDGIFFIHLSVIIFIITDIIGHDYWYIAISLLIYGSINIIISSWLLIEQGK